MRSMYVKKLLPISLLDRFQWTSLYSWSFSWYETTKLFNSNWFLWDFALNLRRPLCVHSIHETALKKGYTGACNFRMLISVISFIITQHFFNKIKIKQKSFMTIWIRFCQKELRHNNEWVLICMSSAERANSTNQEGKYILYSKKKVRD